MLHLLPPLEELAHIQRRPPRARVPRIYHPTRVPARKQPPVRAPRERRDARLVPRQLLPALGARLPRRRLRLLRVNLALRGARVVVPDRALRPADAQHRPVCAPHHRADALRPPAAHHPPRLDVPHLHRARRRRQRQPGRLLTMLLLMMMMRVDSAAAAPAGGEERQRAVLRLQLAHLAHAPAHAHAVAGAAHAHAHAAAVHAVPAAEEERVGGGRVREGRHCWRVGARARRAGARVRGWRRQRKVDPEPRVAQAVLRGALGVVRLHLGLRPRLSLRVERREGREGGAARARGPTTRDGADRGRPTRGPGDRADRNRACTCACAGAQSHGAGGDVRQCEIEIGKGGGVGDVCPRERERGGGIGHG